MNLAQLAALVPWATVEKIGEEAATAIAAYISASKEEQAQIRATASTDMLALYDQVDNHLLDNNRVIDAEVDAKFPPLAMPSADDVAKAAAEPTPNQSIDPSVK